jgi:hypothetical protein
VVCALCFAACGSPAGNNPALPLDPGPPGETLPPEAPAALRVLREDQKLIVKWEAVPAADSYGVYYSRYYTDPEKANPLGTFTSCRAELTGLSNGIPYHVWVKSANQAGPSGYSAMADGTPGIPPLPALPKVSGLEETENGMRISWDFAKDAVSYEVRYGTVPNPVYVSSGNIITTEDSSCEIEGLIDFSACNVWVRSRNSQGYSGYAVPWRGLFSSLAALSDWLGGHPANTAANPYRIGLEGVNLRNLGAHSDGIRPLFETFLGRYVELDLDACSGATVGFGSAYGQTSEGRPDKDKLVSVVLPETSTRVGFCCFQGSESLKYVSFPVNLKNLGRDAFEGCTALEEADLPAGLTKIENAAFANCSSLKTLIVRAASPPELQSGALNGAHPELRIYVPTGSVGAYKAAPGWSAFSGKISAIEEGE